MKDPFVMMSDAIHAIWMVWGITAPLAFAVGVIVGRFFENRQQAK